MENQFDDLEKMIKAVNILRADFLLLNDALEDAVDRLMKYDLKAAEEITKRVCDGLKRHET